MATCIGNRCVHLAVAGGIFDGVFLCCFFFPLDVLDEIWDLIESVSEGFLPTLLVEFTNNYLTWFF